MPTKVGAAVPMLTLQSGASGFGVPPVRDATQNAGAFVERHFLEKGVGLLRLPA